MIGNTIKTNQGVFIVIDKILYPETHWTDIRYTEPQPFIVAVTNYICVCVENKKKAVLINPGDITEIL